MENDDNKITHKTTIQEEFEYWNVIYVFRRVKVYYRDKLRWRNSKELQGMEADDFAMTVMMKIIAEDVSWQRSARVSFMDFVYDVTRGEWSHFIRDNKNRIFISYDFLHDEKGLDNTRLNDNINGF